MDSSLNSPHASEGPKTNTWTSGYIRSAWWVLAYALAGAACGAVVGYVGGIVDDYRLSPPSVRGIDGAKMGGLYAAVLCRGLRPAGAFPRPPVYSPPAE